jgi:hypothetical protein
MSDAPDSPREQPNPQQPEPAAPEPAGPESTTPEPAAPESTTPEPAGSEPVAPSLSGTFADGMAAAARRAGFAAAAEGEPISGHALLAAMGGIRGLVEAVLPGLVFVFAYTFTQALIPALVAPTVIGLVFIVLRRVARQTVTPAVGGLVGTGLSAALALLSGNAADYFISGFLTNAGYAAVLLISPLVGWPLIGVAVGFLMGDGTAWRQDPSKRRVLTILTLCWAGLFLSRLAVQLPLYAAGNVEALGVAKLLMGIPLYAPLLVVSWLMVRSIYPKPDESVADESTGASGD